MQKVKDILAIILSSLGIIIEFMFMAIMMSLMFYMMFIQAPTGFIVLSLPMRIILYVFMQCVWIFGFVLEYKGQKLRKKMLEVQQLMLPEQPKQICPCPYRGGCDSENV